MKLMTLLLSVTFFAMSTVSAAERTWTDRSGRFSVKAELVSLSEGKVKLKRTDGRVITLSVERLSAEDQKFLKSTAKMVVERYAGGQLKARYKTNKDGKKVGAYVEYYESGVVKIRASYRNGQLNGKFASYRPNKKLSLRATYRLGKLQGEVTDYGESGKISRKAEYVDGKLHGLDRRMNGRKVLAEWLWKHGELVLEGTTRSEIKRGLAEITKAEVKGPGTDLMKKSVRRLMGYRFLCGVPYEGLELDKQMNLEAECAAKVCEGLGSLTHTPDRNPGLPQDVFDLGKKGAARSNLHAVGLLRSIDGYMDESHESNIYRLGHRRWCLNPYMLKLGLGQSGTYSALWAIDKSRRVKDWQAVAYPARGYMPTEFFGPRYPWSISLNQRHWVVPAAESLKISIRPEKIGVVKGPAKDAVVPEPLKLDYVGVNKNGMGAGPCVIFRPERIDIQPGRRYRVTIDGITTKKGKPITISYLVEFM